jgi:hypothetical protein
LAEEEPQNIQQDYLAQERFMESERLQKLYLDQKEFNRLANEPRIREGRKMSLVGDDLPKVALNAAYLSHQLDREVSSADYQFERDRYAASVFGQDKVNDAQFFDLVKGEYDVRQQKTAALDDLRLKIAGQTLEDAISGKETPAGTVWTAWRDQYKDLVGGDNELSYMAAAVADREQFRAIASKYKDLAGPGLDLLRKFTTGEASQDELSDFARTLTTIPREEQDTVINLIALGADAGQIDRGSLKEFALAMGQTFSRGFNFIPQRGMQDAQVAFTEIQEVLETGDVWLTGSGEPSLTNVQRPGNTRPMQGVAVIDLRGRKATPEEIEQLQVDARGALDVLRVERQLRAVADNNVDPIKRFFDKGTAMGAVEGGFLGVAGSLPLLTATAVNPFAGMMAYQSLEFDRMMSENPDMDVRAAEGISLVEGAWQAAIDRLQLKTLQGALPVTGRLLGQIKSTGLRRTLGFAASGAEQFGQELVQDIGTMGIDTIASALREDMQDKNFALELGEYWKDAPEVLVSSLIFGMWGGGAITARELKGTPAEWDEAARIVGISEEGRRRMQAATTPEELDAVVNREMQAVTPEARAAGALYAKSKAQAAAAQQADPNEPTLEVTKDNDGNTVYRITTPDNQVLVETTDSQAAQAAFLDYRTASENNEVQALREVIDYWQKRDPNLSISEAPGVLVTDELTRLEGIGDAAGIERLRQRLTAADINPDGDLTGVQIFGSATVEEVGENVYRGTIMVREGASPETVLEEVNHVFVRRALMRGDVTLDLLSGWLDQTAAATGLDIKRGNELEIIESIAQVGMDLFNGRLDQAQLPQSFVDYLRRLMRVIKEIYVRAVKVTEAFDKGEIDSNFESFLMESMGMSPQQQVDLNSTKTAAALVEDTSNDDPDWTVTEDTTRGPDGLTDDERFALEAELREEMERDAAEAAGEGGIDILDAIRQSGGLPAKTSRKVYQYRGELQRIREAQSPGNAIGIKGTMNLFRKNAPDLDALIKDLQDGGFAIETPSDLFELVEQRLRTGRPIYGYEGRVTAGIMDYSIGSRAQPDGVRNVVTLPDVTITGPADYSIGAWHGSPAEFDGFDLGKIGTGEGAQVYGWGLYFAQEKDTAAYYRDQLSKANALMLLDGVPYEGRRNDLASSVDMLIADAWHSMPKNYRTKSELVRELKSRAKTAFKEWKPVFKLAITKAKTDAVEFKHPAYLYSVDLDVDPKELLDWDKPLSEQSAHVKKAIELVLGSDVARRFSSKTGASIYEIAGSDADPVKSAVNKTVPKKVATEALLTAGIKGIRYLDQGSRGSNSEVWQDGDQWAVTYADQQAGQSQTEYFATRQQAEAFDRSLERTYNYVIFDDSLIKILTRNGEQVKSATGNRGTFDPTNPRIDYSLGRRTRLSLAEQLEELQAGESAPVDTNKTFWLIASSDGDIVDILDNEQDATEYFQTTAGSGDWLWEYKDGLRTKVPLLKRGVAERRAEGYIDTVRYEQDEAQGRVLYYGADKSAETTTSAGEIPSHTPDGRVWAGQEESVVYHGGQNLDPQGTDPGGSGTTQTLKPRRPSQTYLFSLGRPRVDRALSAALNAKPGERLAMYERAKEMFDRVAARRGEETGASGYARTLQSLWELDAILKVLPAEVRGKVGGFTQIAALEPTDLYRGEELVTESNSPAGARIAAWMREGLNIGEAGKKTDLPEGYSTRRAVDPARATKATDDFLVKRLATVGKQLDRYLAAEYRIAIERALEAAKPKRSESGVRKSTLGPETQAYADKALAASKLDNDQTAARLAAIEAELLNPDITDEAKIDLVEEWGLVNTLGDLENRNAETLAQAHAELKDRLKAGRAGWRIQEEARIAGQRETVATLLTAFGEPTKSKRFAQKSQVRELVEKLTAAGIDHGNFEQVLRAVFGDQPVVDKWSTMMRKADNADQDMELAMRDQLLEAIKTAAKSAGMRKGQAFRLLKTEAATKVRAMTGRKVADERISIELARKIVNGTADRSNLSQGDVETLREALEALPADTRKEFVTIQRVIFAGNPEEITLTPAQAIQLELSWDQPDVQDKMRREGWTDESIADIRAITSQPVAAGTLAFLRKFYGGNYAQVNPTYARMFGMNMPQAKFYAPSRYKSVAKKDDISLDGSPQVTGSTPGFAKSRVRHSAPIASEDALTVFQQHVVQTAHWVNFAEFSREVRGVLTNLPLQEAIEQKFGQPVVQSLQAWLDQIEQRGANRSREMKWMSDSVGGFLGGTAISSLGFNLRTVAINGDSAMRFLLPLTPRQIGSALMSPVKLAQALPKSWFSPTVQRRLKGGMNPAAQFLYARESVKPGMFSSLGWLSMQPVQLADAAGTTLSSAIVYQATFNDAKAAGMSEAQAESVALEAVDAAVYRYSQPTGFGSKSNVENTAGAFGKLLTLFMSDPRLKTGVMLEAVREIGRGKNVASNVQKLLVVETLALVSHVIASAYRDAFSDEEDEDIWSVEGFALALTLAPFQGLFLAGAVTETALRSLLGMKTWAPPTAPFAGNIESLSSAVRNWEQLFSPETFGEGLNAWNKLLRGVSINVPFGAPAALLNIIKPFVGFQENQEADE